MDITCDLAQPAIVPAQGEVEVEALGLEERSHKSFQQLLVEHAVHTPSIHALAQEGTQSFPRHLWPTRLVAGRQVSRIVVTFEAFDMAIKMSSGYTTICLAMD